MEERNLKLSIIIVNWNTKELLKQCLESVISDLCLVTSNQESKTSPITNHQSPITEIIVVDNGSSDGSVDYVKSITSIKSPTGITGIKLIENKENLGFTKGNNIGIKEAKGEYIMLLNSDTYVKDNAIGKLVGFLEENQKIDIVGPKLLNKDGTPQPSCGRFPHLFISFVMLFTEHFGGNLVRFSPRISGKVDWLMGSAFLTRKKVLEKIGGLDEKIFMYMEEIEWFYRAKLAGFNSYFFKEAEIIHLGRGSSKSGKTEPILNIYKGLIYFYQKHKSRPQLFILKIMLKLKAFLALTLGYFKNDVYLKTTYGQALKIN